MAADDDIARAQTLLGNTGRWSDAIVSDAIDSEGGVPEAAVFLLDSAATAAAFEVDVKAGSQSVKASHVAGALTAAADRIRTAYGLAGGVGTIGTILPTTGRDVLGDDCIGRDTSTLAAVYYNGVGVIGHGEDELC